MVLDDHARQPRAVFPRGAIGQARPRIAKAASQRGKYISPGLTSNSGTSRSTSASRDLVFRDDVPQQHGLRRSGRSGSSSSITASAGSIVPGGGRARTGMPAASSRRRRAWDTRGPPGGLAARTATPSSARPRSNRAAPDCARRWRIVRQQEKAISAAGRAWSEAGDGAHRYVAIQLCGVTTTVGVIAAA